MLFHTCVSLNKVISVLLYNPIQTFQGVCELWNYSKINTWKEFLLLQLSVLLHFSKLDTHLLSFKKNECSMNCMLPDHTLSFFGWFICFGKWTKRSLLYDCRWKVLIFFLSLFENVLRKRFQKKATDTKVILATKQIKQYWSFFRGFSV